VAYADISSWCVLDAHRLQDTLSESSVQD